MAIPSKSCALAREPLYLQVCELLTQQIASGVWQPNAALPNEVELARELGVSSGTVRKALERLEADRLVVRRQGRGTFVVDQTAPDAASRFDRMRHADGDPIVWHTKLIQRSAGEPTPPEQEALGIGPSETVARKRRLLSIASRPFGVEDACLATSHLPGLQADEVGDWCVTALAQRHGIHAARACEEVRTVAASPEIAPLLALRPGTVLLQLDRLIWSADSAPIEWRRLSCHVCDEYYLAEVA
jgi:GntR family transcriptional regulator